MRFCKITQNLEYFSIHADRFHMKKNYLLLRKCLLYQWKDSEFERCYQVDTKRVVGVACRHAVTFRKTRTISPFPWKNLISLLSSPPIKKHVQVYSESQQNYSLRLQTGIPEVNLESPLPKEICIVQNLRTLYLKHNIEITFFFFFFFCNNALLFEVCNKYFWLQNWMNMQGFKKYPKHIVWALCQLLLNIIW